MESTPETRRFEEFGMGGSAVEAVGGLVAVILAILGLVGVRPLGMVAVSDIVVGTALLLEAAVLGAEYSKAFTFGERTRTTQMEWGGGLTAEGAAGIVAVVLGILALVGVKPEVLIACSTIVLGAGVMFGSGVHDRIRSFRLEQSDDRAVRMSLGAAAGAEVLVGFGAIVLGILALIGFAPVVLNLVGVLAIGAVILWTGASAGSHFYYLFRNS